MHTTRAFIDAFFTEVRVSAVAGIAQPRLIDAVGGSRIAVTVNTVAWLRGAGVDIRVAVVTIVFRFGAGIGGGIPIPIAIKIGTTIQVRVEFLLDQMISRGETIWGLVAGDACAVRRTITDGACHAGVGKMDNRELDVLDEEITGGRTAIATDEVGIVKPFPRHGFQIDIDLSHEVFTFSRYHPASCKVTTHDIDIEPVIESGVIRTAPVPIPVQIRAFEIPLPIGHATPCNHEEKREE